MLSLGFRVAHTAYTNACFEHANVIADTPIFSHFKSLDLIYPESKFIYLQRDLDQWLPSISQLLARMRKNLTRQDGGFNPIIKASYKNVFGNLAIENSLNEKALHTCYKSHEAEVDAYFAQDNSKLLRLNLSEPGGFNKLLRFLAISPEDAQVKGFQRINVNGKVTAWNDIQHENKIPSTRAGKCDKLPFI